MSLTYKEYDLSVDKTYSKLLKDGKKPREAWEILEAKIRNKKMDC